MSARILIAALIGSLALSGVVLARLGAFATPEDLRLRRLEARLGRGPRPPRARSLGTSSWCTLVTRLEGWSDLQRQLGLAGSTETTGQWWTRVFAASAIGIAAAAAAAALDLLPLWLGLTLAVAVPPIAYGGLRRRAWRRRHAAGRALGEMLPLFAALGRRPLRDPQQVDAGDPLIALARSVRGRPLAFIVERDGWRALVGNRELRTTSEWFEAVAEAYGIPEAALFAAPLRNATEELSAAVDAEYIRAARTLVERRAADLRARARSRVVTEAVPSADSIVAVLIVVLGSLAAVGLGGAR